jgi:hypothetical protein
MRTEWYRIDAIAGLAASEPPATTDQTLARHPLTDLRSEPATSTSEFFLDLALDLVEFILDLVEFILDLVLGWLAGVVIIAGASSGPNHQRRSCQQRAESSGVSSFRCRFHRDLLGGHPSRMSTRHSHLQTRREPTIQYRQTGETRDGGHSNHPRHPQWRATNLCQERSRRAGFQSVEAPTKTACRRTTAVEVRSELPDSVSRSGAHRISPLSDVFNVGFTSVHRRACSGQLTFMLCNDPVRPVLGFSGRGS